MPIYNSVLVGRCYKSKTLAFKLCIPFVLNSLGSLP